jgi:Zn-dependent peptidase ImmA (M78 family)/DNA-binding XRE family transcriptional regulator
MNEMYRDRGDSPQLALDRLDKDRITFARELRNLTKKELAEAIGKTPSTITQIESGDLRPDLETLINLGMVLQVPTTFFSKKEGTKSIPLDKCHFRAKRSTAQALRRQSVRKGDLCLELFNLLDEYGVVFPREQLTSFPYYGASVNNDDDIEEIALALRVHWGLGPGPIPDIVKLLESKGITIITINQECAELDAYSTWRGNKPCIFLALNKSASRARFDVGHELAHLVLHEDIKTGDLKTEKEAHRFAGAFLAPRESFLAECPRRWNLEAFKKFKLRWKMSISSILYRAKELDILSQSSYQRAMAHLSYIGYRKDEGKEWPHELPSLIGQALNLLKDTVTLEQLASELRIYKHELKDILSQYVPQSLLNYLDRNKPEEIGQIVKLRS